MGRSRVLSRAAVVCRRDGKGDRIGIDLGNGAVKVRIGQTKLLIPNVMAVGMTRADLLESVRPMETLDVY